MKKLDRLRYILGHCGLLANLEIINRVRHNLDLYDYIDEVKHIKDAASSKKKNEHATKMIDLLPKA